MHLTDILRVTWPRERLWRCNKYDDGDSNDDDDSDDDDNGRPPVPDLLQRLRYCLGPMMMMVMTWKCWQWQWYLMKNHLSRISSKGCDIVLDPLQSSMLVPQTWGNHVKYNIVSCCICFVLHLVLCVLVLHLLFYNIVPFVFVLQCFLYCMCYVYATSPCWPITCVARGLLHAKGAYFAYFAYFPTYASTLD